MSTTICGVYMITQQRLKQLSVYDRQEGRFYALVGRSQVKIGDQLGYQHSEGYRRVRVDGKQYQEHRLVWLYYYGELPPEQLDHINGVKSDNRLENLHAVSNAENRKNQRQHRKNTSGIVGVRWHSRGKRYVAHIGVRGKHTHLGRFDNLFDAACARKSAELIHNYHPNHGRSTI